MKKAFAASTGVTAIIALAIAALALVLILQYANTQQPVKISTPTPSSSPAVSLQPSPKEECLPAVQTLIVDGAIESENMQPLNGTNLTEIGKFDLPKGVFAYLPKYPDDLEKIKSEFKAGRQGLGEIDEKYWKQPDFYPGFVEKGVPLIKYYPTDSHAGYGYGTYPSEYIVNTGAGAEFDVYFLVRTDWGVVNYQGLKFLPAYPSKVKMLKNAFSDGTTEVTQDIAYAKCKIQMLEISPGQMALEPGYPTFFPGWVKRVKIKMRTGDIKPGKYAMGLEVVGPDSEFDSKMTQKLLTNYVTGGGFGSGQPWLTLYIDVK